MDPISGSAQPSSSKDQERYQILSKIGQGAYGKVYVASDTQKGELVAIKKISLENEEEGIPTSALREISLLKELKHQNVVRLLDVIHSKKKLTLVFEYLEQDLKKLLEHYSGQGMPETMYKDYLFQLLKGVKYIHRLKILHRDLKPDNLLLSKDGVLKIADFGLARGFALPIQNYTNEVVTLWYRAPDILLGYKNYATSVDMWSIGCIFAEMVIGKPLFQGYTEHDQLTKIFSIIGTPSESSFPFLKNLSEWKPENFETCQSIGLKEIFPNLNEDGIDLLDKLLQFDPEKRISASDALQHHFFDDVENESTLQNLDISK